jgi:hypothetical protein
MSVTDKYKKQIDFIISNMIGKSGLFPVYNSVFLENKHIENIRRYKYNLIVKNTDTMKRATLLLYKDDNLNKRSVIILKDESIFDINIECKEEYHNGSLFDVSFDEEKIIIYDSYIICDYRISSELYSERLNRCNLFKNEILKSELSIKCCDIVDDINEINLKEGEELFFISETLPYIPGINKLSFKWKPSNLIMISLKVEEDNNYLNFYTTNFRNDKLYSQLCYENGTELINYIKSMKNYKNGCIIDFNIEDEKFVPKKVNLEKIYPNNIRYIEKVLIIKSEDLNLFDLKL